MTIDVDWAGTETNPHRIFIPRADMPVVQVSPEIRELDVNVLRGELKDLEASVAGMPWPDTHRHITETTLSGFTYARLFEILAPYTVEFEDGQYSVRSVGANHNLLDVKINNQVSLAVQNSAGLVNSIDIEYASFNGGVLVDPNNTTGLAASGTAFPRGTARRPCSNFTDALAIASERGFTQIFVLGQGLTLNGGLDYDGFRFVGVSPSATSMTVDAAASVQECEFSQMTLDGTFDGLVSFDNCTLTDCMMVEGQITRCGLTGTLTLASGTELIMLECHDEIAGAGEPVIDFGGVGMPVILRRYQGALRMRNKSGAHEVSIDLMPGRLILESTITGGNFLVKGIGNKTDNQSTGTTTVTETALVYADNLDKTLKNTKILVATG